MSSASAVQFSEKPHQPDKFSFPKRSFGKKQAVKRAFQPSWFSCWKWLHYEESADAAICYLCGKAEEGKLKASSKDQAFLQKGFSNWKDAVECFRRHEHNRCHMDAVEV